MFEGTYTALVTPFTASGAVDYGRLRDLVRRQIEAGVDGLVPVGTTGESPTLDMDEHRRVIEAVAEAARGRAKVIAGTGANSTAEAIELVRAARLDDGRWPQGGRYKGQVWFDIDVPKGEPSPWLTFHAIRVLRWWDEL